MYIYDRHPHCIMRRNASYQTIVKRVDFGTACVFRRRTSHLDVAPIVHAARWVSRCRTITSHFQYWVTRILLQGPLLGTNTMRYKGEDELQCHAVGVQLSVQKCTHQPFCCCAGSWVRDKF